MEQSTVQSGGPDQGAAEQAKEKVSEVAGDAQAKASEVASQAQEQAQQLGQQAKTQAREQIDQRSTDAGRKLTTTAADIRSVSEQLRSQGKDGPAKIADEAAGRAERLGSYLERSSGDRLLADIEDFGRRQPWAVIAAGLAAGFVASRFLKASSTERYNALSATGTRQIPPPRPQGNGHSTNPVGSTPYATPGVAPREF